MYKLFLCLRYLKSRAIAYFAVIGVLVCVFMMVVVISLFTGFINEIEKAAKGLFGDVVMSANDQHGVAYYDEFIAHVRKDVPEVHAAAPYILSYGMLRISGQEHYRNPVQIAGVRLPEHAEVSNFEEGLFAQRSGPLTWDPPVKQLIETATAEHERTSDIRAGLESRKFEGPERPREQAYEIRRIGGALTHQSEAMENLRNVEKNRAELVILREALEKALAEGVGPEDVDAAREALAKGKAEGVPADKIAELESRLVVMDGAVRKLDDLQRRVAYYERASYEGPEDRIILGLGIEALSYRTNTGDVVRLWTPGQKVILYVFPLGRRSLDVSELSPEIRNLSVIDDSRSGVPPIDSAFVYVPFKTLQKLNHMEAEYSMDDPKKVVSPPRCSQVIFKVKKEQPTEEELRDISDRIQRSWLGFREHYPGAAMTNVTVETWRQRQRELLSTVEGQRIMMIVVLGVISIVALVLIFVILYVIVMQKTADIGVLKAIGASSMGVAGVFLMYGAALSILGAAIGVVLGERFVRNINSIADWLAIEFGFAPFKEGFLFDRFPDQVQLHTVVYIVIVAIAAGLIGALIPAVKAARMQPVEALRYE
ncbi:MAG: FtsX-like permease family protein [Phycisphaerae bacterium]|jgi:lipoprotein-releasing system permease protein|nr:FtsX-like permease family protein [Phycisphaerae bacterium]